MLLLPPTADALSRSLDVLAAGGIVVHPTETCYGLACDLSNPAAVEKLFAIKKRPSTQPVSALFPSVDEAKRYVIWNDRAEELAVRHLPGPLTLILPLRPDAPTFLYSTPNSSQLTANSSTLGIRVSSHLLAQQLVTRYGRPLSTTSANVHGEPHPYDAHDILARFRDEKAQPDLILDAGKLPEVPPSTVVDLTNQETAVRRTGTILNEDFDKI